MTDEPTEQSYDAFDEEITQWMASVEVRFRKINLQIVATGATAIIGVGLGIMGLRAMANLASSLGQIGQATNALTQVVFGQPVQPNVNPTPTAKPGTIDETPVPDADIAKPVDGPMSEASEEVREKLASDPISPAALSRMDQDQARGIREGDF